MHSSRLPRTTRSRLTGHSTCSAHSTHPRSRAASRVRVRLRLRDKTNSLRKAASHAATEWTRPRRLYPCAMLLLTLCASPQLRFRCSAAPPRALLLEILLALRALLALSALLRRLRCCAHRPPSCALPVHTSHRFLVRPPVPPPPSAHHAALCASRRALLCLRSAHATYLVVAWPGEPLGASAHSLSSVRVSLHPPDARPTFT